MRGEGLCLQALRPLRFPIAERQTPRCCVVPNIVHPFALALRGVHGRQCTKRLAEVSSLAASSLFIILFRRSGVRRPPLH